MSITFDDNGQRECETCEHCHGLEYDACYDHDCSFDESQHENPVVDPRLCPTLKRVVRGNHPGCTDESHSPALWESWTDSTKTQASQKVHVCRWCDYRKVFGA